MLFCIRCHGRSAADQDEATATGIKRALVTSSGTHYCAHCESKIPTETERAPSLLLAYAAGADQQTIARLTADLEDIRARRAAQEALQTAEHGSIQYEVAKIVLSAPAPRPTPEERRAIITHHERTYEHWLGILRTGSVEDIQTAHSDLEAARAAVDALED